MHISDSQNLKLENLPGIPSSIRTAIFDLGDVLFTWSIPHADFPFNPKTLQYMLRSSIWYEYERGRPTEEEVYSSLAKEYSLPIDDVRHAFTIARSSLRPDPAMWDLIRHLKKSGITCYAMSNISTPDWEVLQDAVPREDWGLFDRVFTS